MYDNEDSVCGIIFNDGPFYFQKNLQGDIIGIVDKNANVVATYSYDAWGVCTVTSDTSDVSIATVNPYRYRSYYYDSEIGMYYLQSRYYNPIVGRFVNSDNPLIFLITCFSFDKSLFCYCGNNSISYKDSYGHCYQVESITVSGIELGDGWYYRIDNKNKPSEHMHVFKKRGREDYAQNKNGSLHDKSKNGPGDGPPSKVKKKLKEKTGWDWDEKKRANDEENGDDKKSNTNNSALEKVGEVVVIGGVAYFVYRGTRMLVSAFPPLWWTIPINAVIP